MNEQNLFSINVNKISHAFLIEVDESYNTDFAKNIVKQILKNRVSDLEKIEKLIDSDTFPELKIIRPEGKVIKKEQLSQLMSELNNRPIYSDKFFYIIEYAENLNASSANTILKFLEEPEDGIMAILITKNIYSVLPTIVSRCQILNFNKYRKKEFNTEFLKYAVDLICSYKNYEKFSIAYFSEIYALKADELIEVFNICVMVYSDILKYITTRKKSEFIKNESALDNLVDKFSSSEISIIQRRLNDAINLLKYNVNVRVILDNFLLGSETEYEI